MFPHVFFDASSLVKFGQSISRHLRDLQRRRTLVRVMVDHGLLRISTSGRLFQITLGQLRNMHVPEAATELQDLHIRGTVVLVDDYAQLVQSDPVRAALYDKLSRSWRDVLLRRDPEDAKTLEEAALAYAAFCLIRTGQGYYTPSYMLIVTDDTDILDSRRVLKILLDYTIDMLKREHVPIRRYRVSKLLTVCRWDSFRKYVKHVLTQS